MTFSVRARPGHNSQDGVSQQLEAAPLFLPQLNRLHEAYIVRGQDASNVAGAAIAEHRRTQQIINLWQPFKDLKQNFVDSRRAEHL